MIKLPRVVQEGKSHGQSATTHVHISTSSTMPDPKGTKGNVLQARVWTRPQDLEKASRKATGKLPCELFINKATYKASSTQIHFT